MLPALPYQEICRQLKDALKSPSHLRNCAVARTRRNIVKVLTEKLKRKVLLPGTLRKVCMKIHASCPDAFKVSLNEGSKVSCFKQFCTSLYNALGYVRDVEGIRARRKRSAGESGEGEDADDPEEVNNVLTFILC